MTSSIAPRAVRARRLPLFLLLSATLLCPAAAQAQALVGSDWPATLRGWVAAMLALMATVVGLVSNHHRERPASFLIGMMLSWVVLRATAAPSAAGLRPLLLTLLVLCGVQYLLRQMNWKRSWIDHALLIQCLVVPASLLLTGGQVGALSSVWQAVLSLELVAAMGWALWLRRERLQAGVDDASARDFLLMSVLLLPTMAALVAERVLAATSESL